MRTILRTTIGLVFLVFPVGLGAVQAQTVNNQNYGFNLPSAPRSNGYDEVRTSDGTSCRSSMGGNGAYLDVGGIAGQKNNSGTLNQGTVYGRVIIPLGERPGRIDCRSLYQLEIERLKMQLRAAQAGLGASGSRADWNNQ